MNSAAQRFTEHETERNMHALKPAPDPDAYTVEVRSDEPEPLRMTLKYQIQNSGPALQLNGHHLINPGELFALVALPGQGKSAICEDIVCAHIEGESAFGFRCDNRGKRVLLIDTERPPDDVARSHHNILKRLRAPRLDKDGEIDGLNHLSVSEIGNPERLREIVEGEMATGKYSMLIVDGILDFADSMNDDKDSASVIRWIRSLIVKSNAAGVITMHPNKGTETLAGHLGAFIYRWSRAILFARRVKGDPSVREITAEPEMAKLSHADRATFEPIHYRWNSDKGIFLPCDYTPVNPKNEKSQKNPTNYDDKTHLGLIRHVFKISDKFSGRELNDALRSAAGRHDIHIGESKTREWIAYYEDRGWIKRDEEDGKKLHKYISVLLW